MIIIIPKKFLRTIESPFLDLKKLINFSQPEKELLTSLFVRNYQSKQTCEDVYNKILCRLLLNRKKESVSNIKYRAFLLSDKFLKKY